MYRGEISRLADDEVGDFCLRTFGAGEIDNKAEKNEARRES